MSAKFGGRTNTRATRRNSLSVRLTPRGEALLRAAYTGAVLTVACLLLLGAMGLAGWIEGWK